jgi:hypothetical protein
LPEERKETITVSIYKKGDKNIVVIIRYIPVVNYVQNFIQHTALKVKYKWKGNYWGSSTWNLMQ